MILIVGKYLSGSKTEAAKRICLPLKALRNPKDLSPEELEQCVDSATVGRYAGDIKIEDEKIGSSPFRVGDPNI